MKYLALLTLSLLLLACAKVEDPSLSREGKAYNSVMEKQIPLFNAMAKGLQEIDLESVTATLKYLNSYLSQ